MLHTSRCKVNLLGIYDYAVHLLARDFSFNITLINDTTRAITAITANMLTIVKAFSNAERRLHQLGFLWKNGKQTQS